MDRGSGFDCQEVMAGFLSRSARGLVLGFEAYDNAMTLSPDRQDFFISSSQAYSAFEPTHLKFHRPRDNNLLLTKAGNLKHNCHSSNQHPLPSPLSCLPSKI